jgi:Cu/Zn superoxide dismutase
MEAVAVLTGVVEGHVRFIDSSRCVKISAIFTQLPKGNHGFHIHESGDMRYGCAGACAHYHKGPMQPHGGPPGFNGPRHTGDLGNIDRINHTYRFQLNGVRVVDLLGRSIIVHEDEDDFGRGGESDSHITGHAGSRIACALIGRARGCKEARVTRKS